MSDKIITVSKLTELNQLHEQNCLAARQTIENAQRIGELLTECKASLGHGQWLPWLKANTKISERTARNYMRVFNRRDELKSETIADLTDAYDALAYHAETDLLKVEDNGYDAQPEDEQKRTHPTDVLVREFKARRTARQEPEKAAVFNQVNDNIGWAKWSWNPVTGCLHNCDYCYARDIANRFYTQKFDPTFFPERLDAPANTKLPKNVDSDAAWRRVFTCSMADLFGKWVKKEWITDVFNRISDHQEWEFLCLTKFPQRLAELEWPKNVWAGTTVDRQNRVENAEKSFSNVKAGVKWLSCEPLLEPLKFTTLSMFDWVVIGASTGSTLADPFAPPFEWVVDLYQQARESGCKIYLKHNLFASSDGRGPGMKPVREWPR